MWPGIGAIDFFEKMLNLGVMCRNYILFPGCLDLARRCWREFYDKIQIIMPA